MILTYVYHLGYIVWGASLYQRRESQWPTNQPPKVKGFGPTNGTILWVSWERNSQYYLNSSSHSDTVTIPIFDRQIFWRCPKASRSFRCPAEACLSQGPSPRSRRRFQSCRQPCDSKCRRNSLKGCFWHGSTLVPSSKGKPEVPSWQDGKESWAARSNQNISKYLKKHTWFLDKS